MRHWEEAQPLSSHPAPSRHSPRRDRPSTSREQLRRRAAALACRWQAPAEHLIVGKELTDPPTSPSAALPLFSSRGDTIVDEMKIEKLQLGRCSAIAFDQDGESWAIVLPGAGYSTHAPLLWYARRAALEAGRNALAITDVFDRESDEPVQWVEERCEATLSHLRARDAHPLLITKSLTSLAAPVAATSDLPAVWLTPLISTPGSAIGEQVLAGLRAGTQPRLLVGGADDPSWDGGVASTLSRAEVLELPGSDHSLEVPGDVERSLDNLKRVAQTVMLFATGLE